ncbi:MAG: hypothetical protein CSA66_04225 [Proteobacteria bacterium]|nr:MAG: hypothetical protein CSA66_04225 [Pseudomonadota bacterium]
MKRVPLPVRLADLEQIEAAYQVAGADQRLAIHDRLAFYALLHPAERVALGRRFPGELSDDPEAPEAPRSLRVAWDFRARELTIATLAYATALLEARQMDLVGEVGADEDVAILALTATGSVVALDRPDASGARRYLYKPGARPGQRGHRGAVTLETAVQLGSRVQLGRRRTTELLVLAAGPALPERDATVARAGSALFSPATDEAFPPDLDEAIRVDLVRYRVLVDAAGNAEGDARLEAQRRLRRLARELQVAIGGDPQAGFALDSAAAFETGSGARYEVLRGEGRVDLARYDDADPYDDARPRRFADAELDDQRLVIGAPLVVNHAGRPGERVLSAIFQVAAVTPRP